MVNVFYLLMQKRFHILFLAFIVSFYAAAQDENEIKANFIYSFADYVEWNDTAVKNDKLVVGIIGNNPILIPLVKIAQQKVSDGEQIEIHLWFKTEEISNCNILFIDGSLEKKLPEIFNKIDGKNILTVGDTKNFARKGVIINFVNKSEKVKFEISQKAMAGTNLKISSHLLKLAKFVE